MNRLVSIFLCSLLVSLLWASPVFAKREALLVGVSSYPVSSLEGPINDVAAMKKVLVSNWNFPVENIRILLDKKGTKKNILAAIAHLYDITDSGDEIFIYFSGHGTSAEDRNLNFPLPTTTGAFIPYDVREAKDLQQAFRHLVIGKTDLRPLLEKLDKGKRHVFVAIDACYSGNAVRGAYLDPSKQLPSRFLDLHKMFPGRAFGDDLVHKGSEVWEEKSGGNYEPYPYSNIYYLSASGENEQAKDIPTRLLKFKPTVDGKAHGAFTDTLLRVLIDPKKADSDHNGRVTYQEITKTVRQLMRTRGFDHTPNGLPTVAEDETGLTSRGLFRNVFAQASPKADDKKPKVVAQPAVADKSLPASPNYIRVTLDSGLSGFQKFLDSDTRIRLVNTGDSDLSIKKQGDQIILVSAAGDLITSLERPNNADLITALRQQSRIHKLVSENINQDFNVFLDIQGNGKGSAFVKGEKLGFTIQSDQSSYILMLGIDSKGKMSVLYPFQESELAPIPAKKPFVQKDLIVVGKPYGRDYIQVYAFDKKPKQLAQLMASEIMPNSKNMELLSTMLADKSLKKAEANVVLITTDK